MHHDEFISESIDPVASTFDPAAMAGGEPGLPGRFRWRGREVVITAVLRKWKTTEPCRHGSGERYVGRHWYRVATADGEEMTLYFDRRTGRGRDVHRRWWLAARERKTGE